MSRPPQQTYTPPKGGNGAAQEAQLTAEELAARERNNYVMAGTMLTLVGYGYYVTVIKKPSYSGGCAAWAGRPESAWGWHGRECGAAGCQNHVATELSTVQNDTRGLAA